MILGSVGIAFGGSALVAWAFRERPIHRRLVETPGLTILRPCEGADPGLEAALASSFTAAWPGPREVVICTPGPDDPATALARTVLDQFPDVPARIVHDAEPGWKNPKARRLSGAWAGLTQPIVVQADADIQLGDEDVAQLLAAMTPGVAAVWAAPIAAEAPTWGSRVLRATMGATFYALPVVSGLNAFWNAPPAMAGALMAFRRDALPEGYAPAADDIGDDLALATALARHGRIVLSGRPIVCDRRALDLPTVRAMLRRWLRVGAAPAPARLLGFPFMLTASPLVVVLLPWASGGDLVALLLALALRLLVAGALRAELLGDGFRPLDTLIAEAVVLDAAFGAARDHLLRRPLRWRGRDYALAAGGQIAAVSDTR